MRHFWQQVRTALRDHRWLGLLAAYSVAAVLVQCLIAGVTLREYGRALGIAVNSATFSVVFAFLMMLLFFLYSYARALWETPRRGKGLRGYFLAVANLFDRKCEHYFDSRLFADGLVGLLVLQFMNCVGFQKSLIQYINPYKWDPVFAEWDRLLHFGRHPFEFLLPLMEGSPAWVTQVISFFYGFWILILFATCFYCIFMDPRFYRHMRFLWAYLLSWAILGSFFALTLSSVGPVFFHDFYPQAADIYKPLTDYLRKTAAGAEFGYPRAVSALLKWSRNEFILDFNGISAMPSMHVALSWLLVLYWGSVRRWTLVPGVFFFLLVLFGSVYFAFHYAIDGYFSVIGVSLIWWVSGWIVHRLHPGAKDLLRVLPHKRG